MTGLGVHRISHDTPPAIGDASPWGALTQSVRLDAEIQAVAARMGSGLWLAPEARRLMPFSMMSSHGPAWWASGAAVLARGRLHLLTLAIDAAGLAHVCVAQRADLAASEAQVALRTLDATASLVFERLARRWPLRVRTSPDSSAPWPAGDSEVRRRGAGQAA